MQINHSYFVKKINKTTLGLAEKGKKQELYTMKSMKMEDGELVVELKDNILYFAPDEEPNFYVLIDIERLEPKKVAHLTKEKVREMRKEQLREYFSTHFDEIGMLKRFFEVEGVISLLNIRYEIRRLLGLGYIYNLWEEDLYDILCEFGFKVVMR